MVAVRPRGGPTSAINLPGHRRGLNTLAQVYQERRSLDAVTQHAGDSGRIVRTA